MGQAILTVLILLIQATYKLLHERLDVTLPDNPGIVPLRR